MRPPLTRATITFLFYGRYPVHYKMPPAVLSGSAALAMLHFDANDFDFYYSETGPTSVREGNRQHTYSCLHNEANNLKRGWREGPVFSVLCKYMDCQPLLPTASLFSLSQPVFTHASLTVLQVLLPLPVACPCYVSFHSCIHCQVLTVKLSLDLNCVCSSRLLPPHVLKRTAPLLTLPLPSSFSKLSALSVCPVLIHYGVLH